MATAQKRASGKALSIQGSIRMRRDLVLYVFLIPGLLYLLIFKYVPMLGIMIAFKDYSLFAGNGVFDSFLNSPWVGLENFLRLFRDPQFGQVLANTLIISTYKVVFLFPIPIVLALAVNEVGNALYKKVFQTIVYLPHFLSWVIVGSLFISILATDGPVNGFLSDIGIGRVNFFMDRSLFRPLLVVTAGWKTVGWSSIIYLAAIASVDQEMYEAAYMDGATRLQQTVHITLPSIAGTIVLLLVLRLGYILSAGFEQVLVLYNPTVYKVGDIIETFVYRIGLGQLNFSLGTAVGFFSGVIGFVLIVVSNELAKRFADRSIW